MTNAEYAQGKIFIRSSFSDNNQWGLCFFTIFTIGVIVVGTVSPTKLPQLWICILGMILSCMFYLHTNFREARLIKQLDKAREEEKDYETVLDDIITDMES